MKGEGMERPWRIVCMLVGVALVVAAQHAPGQEKFKLKQGARGKVCLSCHAGFQDKLKSAFVHTPVKREDCAGCHNPHTSSHGKLLDAAEDKVCFRCHARMVPDNSLSVHSIVRKGQCVQCHDPHASQNRDSLLRPGNELCAGCHQDLVGSDQKVKFKHAPVGKGCLNCHNPHASAGADHLLKERVPALCTKCHRTDKPLFAKVHMNYPVGKSDCTSCHNAHGSNRMGILHDTVHKPVAAKMCNQCHEDPASPTPFATRKAGLELCRGCHSTMIKETLDKNVLHGPVADGDSCRNCHSPHASAVAGLLRRPQAELCSRCHPDTLDHQGRAQAKHKPVQEGLCTACHTPHASDRPLLLAKQSLPDVCGGCHNWKKHTTHPIGDAVVDPRDRNVSVDCSSCHRSHGSDYKHMITFPTINDLCTQCHRQYRR